MNDDEIKALVTLGNLPVEFVMVAQECLKRGERIRFLEWQEEQGRNDTPFGGSDD